MALTWKILGGRLKRLREKSGHSQTSVAKALKISQTVVQSIEAGEHPINTLQLEKFTRLCGTDIEDLFPRGRPSRSCVSATGLVSSRSDMYRRGNISLKKLEELMLRLPATPRFYDTSCGILKGAKLTEALRASRQEDKEKHHGKR